MTKKRKKVRQSRRSDKPGAMPVALTVSVTATLTKDDLMSALHGAVLGDTFDVSKWSDLDAEELVQAGYKIKTALLRTRKDQKAASATANPVTRHPVSMPDLERNFRYGQA